MRGAEEMLSSAPITAVVATTDLERAKEFYEGQLGLQPSDQATPGPELQYRCGDGTTLHVYERATAGDSDATCASFKVDDVDGTVDRLRASGVAFEDYDLGEIKTKNGIATFGDAKVAWFKDPDGNILCVSN
jgi:catechol 2,3-dioxygenase-like lactoylglutathione lyase family enzyme